MGADGIYAAVERLTNMLRDSLFLFLALIFFVIWLIAWFAFHVAGGLINILLVIAVIALVIHFLRLRSRKV